MAAPRLPADVHQSADETAFGVAAGFGGDVGLARHAVIVLQLADLVEEVAELVLHGFLARQQAQFSLIEAVTQQLVDGGFQAAGIVEHGYGFGVRFACAAVGHRAASHVVCQS